MRQKTIPYRRGRSVTATLLIRIQGIHLIMLRHHAARNYFVRSQKENRERVRADLSDLASLETTDARHPDERYFARRKFCYILCRRL